MIGLLLALVLVNHQLDDHALMAWRSRYVLLLGIPEKTKSLPWSMINTPPPHQKIEKRLLPLQYYEDADRERNRRLYGVNSIRLNPSMVVLHYTVIDDQESVIRGFLRPSRIAVGNQQPVTSLISVHYIVDIDGSVTQLAPEDRTTSGTYGVDHLALAVEIVAKDEADLMGRPLQLLSAFHLVDSLLKKHDIPITRVFSHQEIACGKLFLSEYTDLADTESPYCYPEPHFRYDPGPTVMAWCREFLLRQRGLWEDHPASER